MKNFNFGNVFAVTRKEIKSYFNSPAAYVVIVVFLLLWEFLFFRSVFLIGEASLRILFDYLPWLLLILVPAITMGSVSQEKSEGTMEFLLTRPLRDLELAVGKFLAAAIFAALVLIFIFPVAFSLSQFGKLDWGVVFGQYLGSVMVSATMVSIGIFISSLFASQIAALLVTAAAGFLLIIAGFGFVTAALPPTLANLAENISLMSHFDSMARGVIDTRDIWYFLSTIAIFIGLAYLQLLKRRFGSRKARYRNHQIGILVFIAAAILVNVAGALIPGRIDLTDSQSYTLSAATVKTMSELKNTVKVTLYASSDLPAQLQPVLRGLKDILRDYQTLGKGNLSLSTKNPSGNQQIAEEAAAAGVRQVQFNVVGQEEFQVKQGFLGISIAYDAKTESIPFIQDTSDLEYQLTSLIKKLTAAEKRKIGFLSGHGEKDPYRDYGIFSKELQKQFEIQNINLLQKISETKSDSAPKNMDEAKEGSAEPIPGDIAVLVIAGPTQEIKSEERGEIKSYLSKSGAVLFMPDTMLIDQASAAVSPNANSFSDFTKEYGAQAQSNTVYDLRSNATVNMGGGLWSVMVPYAFWPQAIASQPNPVTSRIENVVLPWPSSIAIDGKKLQENGLAAATLLATTKFGGTKSGDYTLDPQQKFPQTNLGEQTVALSLSGENGTKGKARIIVVGNSAFLADQFVYNSPQNLAFGINAISWLAQEDSLAGLQIKQNTPRKLVFENNTQIQLVKYGNMAFALLVPAGFGVLRLTRRKMLRKSVYTASESRM